jgi:hypothetical protein
MTAKGLEDFFKDDDKEEEKAPTPRLKGKGKFYHVTLRLTFEQWDRAHQLARAEGVPLAHLAIQGISKILEEKGLPRL